MQFPGFVEALAEAAAVHEAAYAHLEKLQVLATKFRRVQEEQQKAQLEAMDAKQAAADAKLAAIRAETEALKAKTAAMKAKMAAMKQQLQQRGLDAAAADS